MATIASLLVNLGMNTARFDKGAKDARRSMRSIAEGAVALNAAMSIATAGIGAITGALGKFREIGEGIDKVGDLANATGFSTEAISGLQYAAAQTGTEVSSLEAGLKKLSVVLGQAQQAGSPAAMAIEELGLSAQFLNALGPDRAFTSIAEAISRLPTPTEKAAAAVSIFGRNGIELVNMLNQGKSGLAAFHKEAESVGAVLKSNDVETVAKAFDAMDKSVSALTAAFREMTIAAGPAVRLVSTAMSDQLKRLREGKYGEFLFEGTLGVGGLATAQERLKRQDEDALYAGKSRPALIDTEQLEAVTAIKEEETAVYGLKQVMEGLDREQENRNRLIQASLTPLEQYRQKVAEIETAIGKLKTARNSGFMDLGTYSRDLISLETALGRARAEDPARESAERLAESLKTPMEKLNEELAEIAEAERLGYLSPEKAEMARARARGAVNDVGGGGPDGGPLSEVESHRSSALMRGTAEAFSASFGKRYESKTLEKIAASEKESVGLLREIAGKPGIKAAKF